jgi:hypothetical protein
MPKNRVQLSCIGTQHVRSQPAKPLSVSSLGGLEPPACCQTAHRPSPVRTRSGERARRQRQAASAPTSNCCAVSRERLVFFASSVDAGHPAGTGNSLARSTPGESDGYEYPPPKFHCRSWRSCGIDCVACGDRRAKPTTAGLLGGQTGRCKHQGPATTRNYCSADGPRERLASQIERSVGSLSAHIMRRSIEPDRLRTEVRCHKMRVRTSYPTMGL